MGYEEESVYEIHYTDDGDKYYESIEFPTKAEWKQSLLRKRRAMDTICLLGFVNRLARGIIKH